jgi:thiol-disulfide isomerase/thioredoxin
MLLGDWGSVVWLMGVSFFANGIDRVRARRVQGMESMDLEPSTPQENPQDENPTASKLGMRKAIFLAGLFVAVVGILFLTVGPAANRGPQAGSVETYAAARAQFTDLRAPREMPANGITHYIPKGDRAWDKVEVFLKDEKGRPTIINLWATWCPPCRPELESLDKIYDELTAAGASVVPVMTADRSGIGGARYFFRGADIEKLPYFLDHDREFMEALGMRSLPTMLLVSPDGYLLAYALGPKLDSPYTRDILMHFARTGTLPK